jgi:hypothetical protein
LSHVKMTQHKGAPARIYMPARIYSMFCMVLRATIRRTLCRII